CFINVVAFTKIPSSNLIQDLAVSWLEPKPGLRVRNWLDREVNVLDKFPNLRSIFVHGASHESKHCIAVDNSHSRIDESLCYSTAALRNKQNASIFSALNTLCHSSIRIAVPKVVVVSKPNVPEAFENVVKYFCWQFCKVGS